MKRRGLIAATRSVSYGAGYGMWGHSSCNRRSAAAASNAAAELPDKNHPARRVIEQHKCRHREKLIELCDEAGLVEPDLLADKMFLLCEGARVSVQSVGPNGPASRLLEMLDGLITEHSRKNKRR